MKINKIYHGDSRNMDKIDNESVHLTVTSPPYFVGKGYEEYLKDVTDYFQMLYSVFDEVVRVTVPGGKIIINLGDIAVGSNYNGGFPEEMVIMFKLIEHLRTLGAYLYARVIWKKDAPWANSSHVSFHSKIQHAEYRVLPAWEYVFVFRKGKHARVDINVDKERWIDKNLWKKLVQGFWDIRTVHRNNFHEAMFPEELVANCIKLYSFPNDIVLDPFMGFGTVGITAKKFKRNYIGYDLNENYVKKATRRIDAVTEHVVTEPKPFRDKTVNRELQEEWNSEVPM